MAFKEYREQSKRIWGEDRESELCGDQIKLGAILRIADAAELMAKNYSQLINERDMYKRWWEESKDSNTRLIHRVAGLMGYIKRMRKI